MAQIQRKGTRLLLTFCRRVWRSLLQHSPFAYFLQEGAEKFLVEYEQKEPDLREDIESLKKVCYPLCRTVHCAAQYTKLHADVFALGHLLLVYCLAFAPASQAVQCALQS